MSSKISIQIVTFNSKRFLKDCLDSIFRQSLQDFSVLVIDNASNDGSFDFVKNNYSSEKIKQEFGSFSRLFAVRNARNLGFSQAQNQGIIFTDSEFILIMNADVILEPDFLENLVKAIEPNEKIGSAGGKLLKIKLGDQEIEEKIKTDTLDSAGLRILKSRRFIDRGAGEKDKKRYDKKTEVFGISGACVLYRRSALEDIKVPIVNSHKCLPTQAGTRASRAEGEDAPFAYEYFDQDFFAYQEDNDLAWRLKLRDWSAVCAPQAKAYHFRSMGISGKLGLLKTAQAHLRRPKLIEYFSFRNGLWLLFKNDFCINIFFHLYFILFHLALKKIYLLFTQPINFIKSGLSFYQGLPKMFRKRRYIIKRAKISSREIRKWME